MYNDYGDITALVVACRCKNHEIVKRLLQVPGIDVNYKCGDWKLTAMHLASHYSDKCCEELAKHQDVDWNSVTSIGDETPLHRAISFGKAATTKVIMKLPGVDFTIKNMDGYTVAQLAAMSQYYDTYNIECLKLMTEVEQADFNVTDIQLCGHSRKTRWIDLRSWLTAPGLISI